MKYFITGTKEVSKSEYIIYLKGRLDYWISRKPKEIEEEKDRHLKNLAKIEKKYDSTINRINKELEALKGE